MEYEYEAAMEKHYRNSLLKAFRKTVNDGYFPFIIVDCVNHQVKHFEEMWSYAKQKGFQVCLKVFSCNCVSWYLYFEYFETLIFSLWLL